MAIDTAEKRRAVAGISGIPFGPNVTPNVAKGAMWRQEAVGSYPGIATTWSSIASSLTLKEILEEHDVRHAFCRVIIGGAILPRLTSVNYRFDNGQVPTATIVIPGLRHLPASVVEEASVEIWLGYRKGVSILEKLVFGGAVVDSVGNSGSDFVIECVMDGPRKLTYSYNRTIDYEFAAVEAEEAVIDLMTLAGVKNYAVNLSPWIIGTATPQTIEFSTYGEAINKIAEVDGSPWYAMPTGQVRVELRDPLPSTTAHREYFTGVLTGPISTVPTAVSNSNAKPRINDIQRNKFRAEVANFITVEGAVVVSLGPNGEQNSEQVVEEVSGESGRFRNGAHWISTPPLYQHFSFNNELIDTNAKAFAVAQRYFTLKNRLVEKIPLSIPGDPDVFLGETVKIIDPSYTGIESLYFVDGYSTTIDDGGCTTLLQLVGGEYSGTTGFASPFAEFIWKYQAIHNLIPGGSWNFSQIDLGEKSDIGAKLCMDIVEGTGESSETGGGIGAGEDKPVVFISFDGTVSDDFDGQIARWDWEDDNGHSGTGPRITIAYDPADVNSIEMTLTVTDDTGRTDSITKTVYTSADYLEVPGSEDNTMNDTENGGGVTIGDCTEGGEEGNGETEIEGGEGTVGPGGCNGMQLGYYVAAGDYAMGTKDNRTWNDLTKVAAGVTGDFISVASGIVFKSGQTIAIFGTENGEIVRSLDTCVTGTKTFQVPSGARIESIWFDNVQAGAVDVSIDTEHVPVHDEAHGGVLSIVQAYQQCRAVGFDHTPAVMAVAIMMAESGLNSSASNSAGNTPPSTDRGIAQINDYWHPEVSNAEAYNSASAIRHMFRISSQGTNFNQWTTYVVGAHIQYLSRIQDAVGKADIGEGADFTTNVGEDPIIPRMMQVWATTSDGQIYTSYDSGATWELWANLGDGKPIYKIGSPLGLDVGDNLNALWIFGGDTVNIESLIRADVHRDRVFAPLPIGGALAEAITLAGPGHTIKTFSQNQTAILIGFSGGVNPLVWISQDPLGDPESWQPVEGIDGPSINTSAAGWDSGFLVADDDSDVSVTDNNINFLEYSGNAPSSINHLFWMGIEGLYLAAADGGVLMSMDKGAGFGFYRPNTEFGTTWPAGAVGHQVAVAIGPRTCNEPIDLLWIIYVPADGWTGEYVPPEGWDAQRFLGGVGSSGEVDTQVFCRHPIVDFATNWPDISGHVPGDAVFQGINAPTNYAATMLEQPVGDSNPPDHHGYLGLNARFFNCTAYRAAGTPATPTIQPSPTYGGGGDTPDPIPMTLVANIVGPTSNHRFTLWSQDHTFMNPPTASIGFAVDFGAQVQGSIRGTYDGVFEITSVFGAGETGGYNIKEGPWSILRTVQVISAGSGNTIDVEGHIFTWGDPYGNPSFPLGPAPTQWLAVGISIRKEF